MGMSLLQMRTLLVQDEQTLARWFCALNRWGWPEELPEPDLSRDYESGGVRGDILHWIERTIGSRRVLREWNKDMTDAQFTVFWHDHHMRGFS